MKVTSIRIKGKKPSELQLKIIANTLNTRFARAGFITECGPINSTSIKIGLHMRTFSLDVSKHDRNLHCNPHAQKLTNLPNWDQRVEFNDIVNEILNKLKVSANVKSGPYTIREGFKVFTENDWYDQKPDWIHSNEIRGYRIEAIDEKEYLEERRIRRNREAAHKRNMAKQAEGAAQNVPTLKLVRES